MGTATALRQLLRSLCLNLPWEYAVLWRLKDQSDMLLTWEDGYFSNAKSGGTMENVVHNGFLNDKPTIISFGCEPAAQSGAVKCPIELAVTNTSHLSYALGEGIVGKVALRSQHHWAFAAEFDCRLQSECPEEWQLQFAAGIKTILLVPVIPLGVVQLGSLDKVIEDFVMVAQIRNLFGSIKHATGTCISMAQRVVHADPCTPFIIPPTGHLSESSFTTGGLPNLIHLRMSPKRDSCPDYGQVTKNKVPYSRSHLIPSIRAQTDFPFLQNDMDQILLADTSYSTNESTWKALCSDVLFNDNEEALTLSQSMNPDMSNYACLWDENIISSINCRLIPEEAVISNVFLEDPVHNNYELFYANSTIEQEFGTDYDEEKNALIDNGCLNYSFESELHKMFRFTSLKEQDDLVWNDILSYADELNSSAAVYPMQMSEASGSLFEGPDALFTKKSRTEHLLDAVVANMCNASDYESSIISGCITTCANSSRKFSDPSSTHCKAEGDILMLEDSLSGSQGTSVLASKNEGMTSSPTGASSESRKSMLSINKEQLDEGMTYGTFKRGLKAAHGSKRRGKGSEFHRLRPRDRQLIQDRIKELRELIPNGSKCSIDSLLDRTVKHMLFLQNIPHQAEKLRHSTCRKVKVEDQNLPGNKACVKGASWAYELGGQPKVLPLTVEDLEVPGQMIVEMQCKEYGLFLEIAQILKRLELTILKGILETRSDKLWAHFIVEASSKGFHRMDVLWPLMELLQRNAIPLQINF